MAVIPLKYDVSSKAVWVWKSINEMGNSMGIPFSCSVNKSGDFYVWNEIVEDLSDSPPTYKISPDGKIHSFQFFEGYPAIPNYGSGTFTFDDMNSYVSESFLDGLNSGSNEWNNVTPYAAYFARQVYAPQILSTDFFLLYQLSMSVYPFIQGFGNGKWLDSGYDWYGKKAFLPTVIIDAMTYPTGSNLNGQNGTNLVPELYVSWSEWSASTNVMYGIKAVDRIETYNTGTNLNGQTGSEFPWQAWTSAWRTI